MSLGLQDVEVKDLKKKKQGKPVKQTNNNLKKTTANFFSNEIPHYLEILWLTD